VNRHIYKIATCIYLHINLVPKYVTCELTHLITIFSNPYICILTHFCSLSLIHSLPLMYTTKYHFVIFTYFHFITTHTCLFHKHPHGSQSTCSTTHTRSPLNYSPNSLFSIPKCTIHTRLS
jgi:hypothetical protein